MLSYRPLILFAGLTALTCAMPVAATLATPPQSAATREAQAYLFHGGAGDVFEITTSSLAIQNSRNPAVRAYATMLIDHHSKATNSALDTAKAAGVMPPPPELIAVQKAMITQLLAAGPETFDRVYLTQQVPAHQQALALVQGYAAQGDMPALRQAAQAMIPVVQAHLTQARQLLGTVR